MMGLGREALQRETSIQHAAGQEVSAARALGEDLDELEALAAQLLTVRNRVRIKARALHTSREVGDAQTSEAELVAAPLRREVVDLKEHVHTCEQEIIRLTKELEDYRTHHHCTSSCRENAHVAFTGKGMVQDLQAKLAEAEMKVAELEALHVELRQVDDGPPPAECLTVHKLTRQLDVSQSQVSALQHRKEDLLIRVGELAEMLAKREGELDEMKQVAASRTDQVDRLNIRNTTLEREREAQQNAKQAAWERLATIERLAYAQPVRDALKPGNDPADYALVLAEALLEIRETLKGFS